jgi:hypothetical protein
MSSKPVQHGPDSIHCAVDVNVRDCRERRANHEPNSARLFELQRRRRVGSGVRGLILHRNLLQFVKSPFGKRPLDYCQVPMAF